ncbi:MAG: DNA ligase D [Variibacter sp.]|nr:DNA ligase D [Variibacter sp.]
MALEQYRAKRNFNVTREPRGKKGKAGGAAFVIQKHAARRLHYDLRLELDGVMKSWAITRGPSLVPGEKRLAVHVEDHPIAYNAFEGTIPEGEYGAGTVMIWDRGRWIPEGDPHVGYEKGHLDFRLDGEKLKGRWHLVRMRRRDNDRQEPWLLIKGDDEAARAPDDPDILEEKPLSVATGRSMEEIKAGKPVRKRSARGTIPAAAVWSGQRMKSALEAEGKPQPQEKRARPRGPRGSKSKSPRPAGRTRTAGKRRGSSVSTQPRKAVARAAPLPDFVPPCLAQLSDRPPDGAGWIHEIKFDGYRMQARIAKGHVQIKTRRGLDWTRKFRPVAEALSALPVRQALIDGEAVVETEKGLSSFAALQEALKSGRGPFAFYAFDLLHLDGRDIARLPLIERKEMLAPLIGALPPQGTVRFSAHFETQGSVLLRHACKMDLEGIVSKRRDAPYRSGRTGDWIKTKCANRQEFVVVGYAPATHEARAVGALILGYYEDGVLRYAGRGGTGFSRAGARDLWRQLDPLRRADSPIKPQPPDERGRPHIWTEPRFVAEVDFRGWTHGMRLRQPSFKGLRFDKVATEVVREAESMPSAVPAHRASKRKATRATSAGQDRGQDPAAASTAHARLTHPDRVYWPDIGLTKQGLADYYASVWDWMAPHVVNRALSLVRCPEGAGAPCFFQKHASAGLDSERLRLVPEDGDHVIAIDDLDGLLALVQAGVLEIHVRGSTLARLDAANRIVFDLDPGPDVGWSDVVGAAREVRERLESLGLVSYVKTTGGKGLHVVVPIECAPWDEVKAFTRALAFAMVADSPDRYIATASKRQRAGRIFIDYLRNSREATAICAYSTRARPGATVSTPIAWSELGSLDAASRYTVGNLGRRLSRLKRDPWGDIADRKQRLPQLSPARR